MERNALGDAEGGAFGRGVNLKFVHRAPGSDKAHAKAGVRSIAAFQDSIEVGYSGTAVGDSPFEALERLEFERECDPSVAGVAERVSCQLRGGDGHPDLVLIIQTQTCCYFAGALWRLNNVSFSAHSEVDDRNRHRIQAAAGLAARIALSLKRCLTAARPAHGSRRSRARH